MNDSTDNARGPKRIWAFYTPDDFEDGATITAYETVQHGAETYIRADLAPDPMDDPRVKALVEALRAAADELDDYSPLTGNTIETSASRAARAAFEGDKTDG